ncbi:MULTISPECIES: OmpW family protein [unclassified Acinetobacter]|uniref:OmpW/AlkL family protein n=1 Tax=unclassified Acinetobacter TaxID=196816 RepID=UPI0035B97845
MLKQTLLVAALVGLSSAAFAGPVTVKLGASVVDITGKSDLANGAVKNAQATDVVAFTPSIDYRIGETPFSAEILLANPMKHTVKTDSGNIASLKQLPPTLTVKYNSPEYKGFSGYVGAGATVFTPWDVKGEGALANAEVKAKTAVGPAAQIGVNFKPDTSKNWGVFADARYADLKTDVQVGGQSVGKLKLNPVVYTLGYSVNF